MNSPVKLLSSTALVAAALVMAAPNAFAQDIGSLEKRAKALEKAGASDFFAPYLRLATGLPRRNGLTWDP